MSKAVFITATDTDAGKTWVTSQLTHALLKQRANVKALKPIACGLNANGDNDDVHTLLKVQDLKLAADINLHTFAEPAAPSIAAAAEGKYIHPNDLVTWCQQHSHHADICLIEAIGGLMVPITPNYLVSDWLLAMPNMPVILVVRAKLGCINHALLSMSHLSHIGRKPTWIIINNSDGKQNTRNIKHALLPYISEPSRLIECAYGQAEDLSAIVESLRSSQA